MHRIVIVNAGVSVPSSTRNLAEQLGGAVQAALSARGEAAETTHIDIRDFASDLANSFLSPGFSAPALAEAITAVSEADALIAVTPIYKASYSGLFKMFFDVLDTDALVDKPVLFAATAGTPRHSLALEHAVRPLFSFLRARTIPTAVFAATADFGTDAGQALTERIQRAARELGTSLLADASSVGGLGGAYARGAEIKSELPENDKSFADLLKKYQ